eukprot:gene20042-22009_t
MQSTFRSVRNASVCIVPGLKDLTDELGGPKVSRIYSDDDLSGETVVRTSHSYDRNVICQLLTHIPDSVINYNQRVAMPARKESIGVAMFADISGFTALCEKYADMVTQDSALGTDKLTATLNNYIGQIVDGIIKDGGDVLKFAGDAILASWVFSHSGHNIKTVLAKAIRCGLAIQDKCDNQLTEVGVLLRVKIAMAVGSMIITFVGEEGSKQFDLSGSAIDEVGAAEKHAKPGDVILTQLAWSNCDQDAFRVEKLENLDLFKVSEDKRIVDVLKTSLSLANNITGMFSEMKNSTLARSNHVVICPEMDELIAQCPDCHYDLPKALLPDSEDSELRRFTPTQVAIENWRSNSEKDRKFDRQKMNFNLDDEQVQELRSYVAIPVLDKLDNGQDLEWLSEMRQVSVLFINMRLPVGSDDAAFALQKAFEVIYEAVLKFKGNLNKVFSFDKGCTFVVIFGLPGCKHEDDAARALRSAQMVYEALHSVPEITDESIGVTTGKAFCGVVGHKDRHEYTVIGRKVNMAARLMMNYPGIVSCDPETYEAAKSKLRRLDFTTLPFKLLKGIKEPGIIREYNPSANSNEEEKEYDYPILGREKEVSQISEILQKAKENTNVNAVAIEGEAGIGKTRLLEEVMDIAENEGFRLHYIEVDSSQSLAPFNVIGMLVSSLLGLEHCRSSLEKEHILFDIVKDKEIRQDLSLLNDLIGTEVVADAKFTDMDNDERTSCFHGLLFYLIQSVAKIRPNIFIIDNAQFVDPESWEFFSDFLWESHTVLTLAMRSFSSSNPAPCEEAIKLLQNEKTRRFILEGLHEDVMSDVACQLLQAYRIPRKLDDMLRSKSNGVPSWCEQLVKELVTTNVLKVGPDSMQLAELVQSSQEYNNTSETPETATSQLQSLAPEFSSAASKRRWSIARNVTLPFKRGSLGRSTDGSSDGDSRRSSNNYPSTIMRSRKTSDDSAASERTFKLYDLYKRRVSTDSVKSVRICLEMNETLDPVCEDLDEFEEDFHSRMQLKHKFIEEYFVYASEGAVPDDVDNTCIVTPGREISDEIVPISLNDVVVARLDRMSLNEQLILKFASILGMNFKRSLLSAIVPRNVASVLDATLYRLCKERLFECGSLALLQSHQHNNQKDELQAKSSSHHHHHRKHSVDLNSKYKHHVYCGCYADEDEAPIDLSQNNRMSSGRKKFCLYFHFSNSFVRDAAYDLWLEDQRKALHERAAMYLETQIHLCKSCGGDSFVPGMKSKTISRHLFVSDSLGKSSARMERKKMQATAQFSRVAQPKGTMFSKILHGDSRPKGTKEELQNEAGYFTKRRQVGTRGDGIGRALIDMAGIINQGIINQSQSKNQFKSIVQKLRKSKTTVAPNAESVTMAVLAQFQKMISTSDRNSSIRRPSLLANKNDSGKNRAKAVNISECYCNDVLAITYPQLVYHWKSAKNDLKKFHYMIESAAALISIHSNMQALSYLNEIETIIKINDSAVDNEEAFFITVEDKARVELLNGQALMNMNRINEAIKHFILSLKHLGNVHPTSTFGIMVRTRAAYMTQILHKRMPDTFKERSEETSHFYIEQARCFTQLAHAYHLLHDKKRSFMVALEHLNAVEEAEDDWVELMLALSSMIECCQLTNRIKLGNEYETIALAKVRPEYKTVEEVLAAIQLYSVLLSFRFYKGNITSATNAGFEALHLANTIGNVKVNITVIPLLAQALLLLSRVQACHEVLQDLRKATRSLEDIYGEALYYCCCLDLLIEPGRPIESLNNCVEFATKITNDPTLSSDVIPRFSLNASLALMFARQRRWDIALSYYNQALILEPGYSEMFLYCRAYAKIVEYNLLHFREHRKNPKEKAICNQVLKKFKTLAKKYTVLLPRLYHLQAYFAYLRGKSSRAKLLIEDCLVASNSLEPMFEVDWAMSSKHDWFSNEVERHDNDEIYDGKTKFYLPR